MSSTLLEYTRSAPHLCSPLSFVHNHSCELWLSTAGCHEDIERLERRIVAEYKQDAKGHKERLTQTLRVKTMLDQLQDKARRLVRARRLAGSQLAGHALTHRVQEEVYADEDNARKDEIAALAGDEPIS